MQAIFKTVWCDVVVKAEKRVKLKLEWKCTYCNRTMYYHGAIIENVFIRCQECFEEYSVSANIKVGTPPTD